MRFSSAFSIWSASFSALSLEFSTLSLVRGSVDVLILPSVRAPTTIGLFVESLSVGGGQERLDEEIYVKRSLQELQKIPLSPLPHGAPACS